MPKRKPPTGRLPIRRQFKLDEIANANRVPVVEVILYHLNNTGSQERAAAALGVTRQSIRNWMDRFGIIKGVDGFWVIAEKERSP